MSLFVCFFLQKPHQSFEIKNKITYFTEDPFVFNTAQKSHSKKGTKAVSQA